MERENIKKYFNIALNFIFYAILFGIIAILLGVAAFTTSPNNQGFVNVFLPPFCAAPISFGLFFGLSFIKKVKPYQRYILSILVLPVISGLFIGWALFQQRPMNIFRVFVTDPIPTGISNIQAHDDSIGIDETIYVAFHATPSAINQIIEFNGLAQSEDEEPNLQFQNFEGINWPEEEKWKVYDFYDGNISMTMWVDPNGDTVLFLWETF